MLKTLIKTKHISTMSLNFYFVFFILSTSSWFTSALKCYKCEEKNPDADLINSFCSRLYNKNSWEIVECSGSCFSGSKPNPNVQGRRVGQRFVNPTYPLRLYFLQFWPVVLWLYLKRAYWNPKSSQWPNLDCLANRGGPVHVFKTSIIHSP